MQIMSRQTKSLGLVMLTALSCLGTITRVSEQGVLHDVKNMHHCNYQVIIKYSNQWSVYV